MSDPLQTYVEALEQLRADNLDSVLALVSENIHFTDPFNDCHSRARYRAVLIDMFDKLGEVRFVVDDYAWSNDVAARRALLRWTLSAELFERPWEVCGCSALGFDDRDLLIAHHDYWDAATAVYERIPILGRLLRSIRRRISIE